MKKFRLMSNVCSDVTLEAIGHLTALMEVEIVTYYFSLDEDASLELHLNETNWKEELEKLVIPPFIASTDEERWVGEGRSRVTPYGFYHLRHLHKLRKMKLEIEKNGWCLALVPFINGNRGFSSSNSASSPSLPLPLDSSMVESRNIAETSKTSPLSFWSSFPLLDSFEYTSYCSATYCLSSLDDLLPLNDSIPLHSAIKELSTETDTTSKGSAGSNGFKRAKRSNQIRNQDLLLFALGANSSIRHLHINPARCHGEAICTFARQAMRRIIQQVETRRSHTPPSSPSISSPISSSFSAPLIPLSTLHLDMRIVYSDASSSLRSAFFLFGFSLRVLYLSGLLLSDEELEEILDVCPGLHSLELQRCEGVMTERSLKAIGEKLPALGRLNLTGWKGMIDDAAVEKLLTLTPRLHFLGLKGTSTTAAGLLPRLHHYPQLKTIEVAATTNGMWTAKNIRDYRTHHGDTSAVEILVDPLVFESDDDDDDDEYYDWDYNDFGFWDDYTYDYTYKSTYKYGYD